MKPRLLDLFCGAGGCAKGYQRAGFYVVGVDVNPQPRYCGDEFVQADALEVLDRLTFGLSLVDGDLRRHIEDFDAIHASPPCQAYSDLRTMPGVEGAYPELVDAVRELLTATGLPYVIENVPGSPVAHSATLDGRWGVRLDGAMFGLEENEYGLERERWFECSWPVEQPNGRRRAPMRVGVHGGGQPGRAGGRDRRVMGIDWMSRDELNEAIPPAYTEFIGQQLLDHIRAKAVA